MQPIGDWTDVIGDLTPEDRQKLILGTGVIAFGVAFGSAIGESVREGSWMEAVKDEPLTGGQLISTMVAAGVGTAMFGSMVSSAAKEYGWRNLLLYSVGLTGLTLGIRAVRSLRGA
jgi:hypothetical protein